MKQVIPYGKQSISDDDVQAVIRVLRSDYLTQGPVVPAFEKAVANYCHARHGVAVNSATSALHVACLALSVGPGDWVWTSPITFVASANCALYCGAKVGFVDIDPRTYNLSVECLERKLEGAERDGCLPKVVIPVHLCGQPCNMAGIHALSRRYGFRIIEDASHAIGGKYRDEPIGNCRYSDITVFSFHPVKIITTGEGGMTLTNNDCLAKTMRLLRSHGITRDCNDMTYLSEGPWYYEQIELGFNYRMTDLQAALGLSQVRRLDEFVSRRNELAQRYEKAFENLPIRRQFVPNDSWSARHLYVIRVDALRHREIFERLQFKGIGVNVHYIPVHRQPYYRNLGFQEGSFPEAEKYGRETISLPLFPEFSNATQDHVVATIRSLFECELPLSAPTETMREYREIPTRFPRRSVEL